MKSTKKPNKLNLFIRPTHSTISHESYNHKEKINAPINPNRIDTFYKYTMCPNPFDSLLFYEIVFISNGCYITWVYETEEMQNEAYQKLLDSFVEYFD